MAYRLSNAERIQGLLEAVRKLDASGTPDFMSSFQPHLSFVSADEFGADARHATHPRVVFRYVVQPEHCNRLGNMHGGAVATLFDFCTSLALALAPHDDDAATAAADTSAAPADIRDYDIAQAWARLGVSRTLAVTYVRPAPCGAEVLVECEQVHAGQRMSSLRGTMRRCSDRAVLSTCEHGKVVAGSKM